MGEVLTLTAGPFEVRVLMAEQIARVTCCSLTYLAVVVHVVTNLMWERPKELSCPDRFEPRPNGPETAAMRDLVAIPPKTFNLVGVFKIERVRPFKRPCSFLRFENYRRACSPGKRREVRESSPYTRKNALLSSRLTKDQRPNPRHVVAWEQPENPQRVLYSHRMNKPR
jgi:hypothetical protein